MIREKKETIERVGNVKETPVTFLGAHRKNKKIISK